MAGEAFDAVRLDRLLEAGRGLLSELDMGIVLDRLLETARELTGARYAALGVLDEQRRELAAFYTRGVDAEIHAAIGDLPRGRGVLGVLIERPQALRLHDVGAHPQSYGFPPGHPPMSTFLGMPIVIRGEAWGNLYLTEKEGGDFDEADEQSVAVLADWAAVAVENARLYEAVDARRDELERAVRGFEATSAVVRAVGGETDLDRVLELIVKRGRALVEARSVLVLLCEGEELRVAATAGEAFGPQDARVPLAGSPWEQALAGEAPLRVADARELSAPALGVAGDGEALLAPLRYRGRTLGVLATFDRPRTPARFTQDDEHVLAAFAASAATAVATAQTVEAERLRHSLRAAEEERRRWARELHDETLQGLAGLKVLLAGARRSTDMAGLHRALDEAVEQVEHEVQSLRDIIVDVRPAALDALGLEPALHGLADRTATRHGLAVDAAVDLPVRLPEELEGVVYRVVQEALTNVAKHAGASRLELEVRAEDGRVVVRVADDGVGFDPAARTSGYGLTGMRERVTLAGGTLAVEPRRPSQPGTVVRAVLPAPQPPGETSSSPRSIA